MDNEARVLDTLRHGDLSGAEIIDRIEREGGRLTVSNLYVILNRLRLSGAIWRADGEDAGGHPARRYGLRRDPKQGAE